MQVEVNAKSASLLPLQLEELVKLLEGKESEIVMPDYATKIVDALEKAVNMM